jgi:hypothetical protein
MRQLRGDVLPPLKKQKPKPEPERKDRRITDFVSSDHKVE